MKICYFIQSHKNPEQICRLIRAIKQGNPNSQVLVNHNFGISNLDLRDVGNYSGIELLQRSKSIKRANSSILETYLEAIRLLGDRGFDFDWLICLSGQDYPTQPISKIEQFLSKTEYDGFIRYYDPLAEKSAWNEKSIQRFFHQYVQLPDSTAWLLRKYSGKIEHYTPLIVKWRYSMVGLKTKTPFDRNFKCYRGWYWNTLSRNCIKFLINYLSEHPNILRYYKRTIGPEESLIQTVLVNSQQFNLCNDDKRYYDYPLELGGYARLLTVTDYPSVTNGNFHFARKFDAEIDSEILDLLDTQVLNNSPLAPERIQKSNSCD
ncbi:MAG: hypothetical protein N4J56_006085 [Chroococcidiopsis sp. SAG 2025]|uniref:beta-1,6-N-acetylglucosaminyltransferase n=1 Tax=Chroococcidiopsis sp. SAG 2025 TaxID=171389 RepID=UPI0029372350|nr:beta-1,6-N-acetylglucosaminyltransferase [Chroococcidiopsis sp. SAG 2025]MDV2996431.1 hypothetical protein [Chroococcidiopsis sp. SAG 2025]